MDNPTHLQTIEYIAKLETQVQYLTDEVMRLHDALSIYTLDHSENGFDYE